MISIMFHSAGLNSLEWRSAHISDPLDIVREKLEVIRDEGYRTITMREAGENIGKKRDGLVHLCFDDGYLDNRVHIFPILKEFGLKATIFMTTDFVDPRDINRDLKSIYERHHDSKDCCAGFLSYSEMKEMEASGHIEIQSHALTHTWYFKGPRIVDFWHPGSATEAMGPIWMIWNRFPEKKPFYLSEAVDLEKQVPYGTPVYEHGKSLETIRYFPDEKDLEQRLVDHVASRPAVFFENPGWKTELDSIAGEYRKNEGEKGRYESKDAHDARIRHELIESKQLLEEGLGHEIRGLCLPGGGVTRDTVMAARESGYIDFTLPSRLKGSSDNDLIEGMIPRIGNLPCVMLKGKDLGYPSRSDFRNHLKMNNGYSSARIPYDISRLKRLLSAG